MMQTDVYVVCWCGREDCGTLGVYISLGAAKAKITALARKCHDVKMRPNGESFICYEDEQGQLYYIDRTVLYS